MLNTLGILEHDAKMGTLSGGQKKRAALARTLLLPSDILILDEPTNHLDISYQMQIFDFIQRLNGTVLSAIHDLNMAALYCDRLYVMEKGHLVLDGTPEELFRSGLLDEVFGIRARKIDDETFVFTKKEDSE